MSIDTPSKTLSARGWRVRAIIAFAVAPVSLGLLALMFPSGFWALSFSAAFGYPIAILVGLPLFFLSKATGRTGIWSYALFALVCGFILIAAFVVVPALSQGEKISDLLSSSARWAQMLLAVFVSTFSVGVFWLIARPDRA